MREIIFFLLVPFIALFFEWMHRKLIAKFQNRIGPPLLQPFYDLRKLWRKRKMKTQNDPFFKTAPFFYFISTYALFLLIPFPIISFNYDFIFLIYLTILGSAFYVLAGVSSDSPYGIVGAVREMILMILYEISLAVIIFTFIIFAGVLSLSAFTSSLMIINLPIASVCLIITAFLELHITPFDTAEAKTEILLGIETEYPGKNLFFIELTKYLKRLFYILLCPLLFFGMHDPILFIIAGLSMLFLFSFCQATTPRYRVDQAFKVLFIVLIFALIEFVRISWGII